MSVNQTTAVNEESAAAVPAAAEPVNAMPPEAKVGGRPADRTDMVGKALGLLVLLGDEPRGASAAEISRRAELPFSTTYRLLGSLTRDGFVDYEPDGRRYHLACASSSWASVCPTIMVSPVLRRPSCAGSPPRPARQPSSASATATIT